jgi:hypothetical protein
MQDLAVLRIDVASVDYLVLSVHQDQRVDIANQQRPGRR